MFQSQSMMGKASAAEKAASLNYQYEESVAHRLEAQGKLKDSEKEFAKAAGDKPAMKAAFGRSDALRNELKAHGIELEDRPDGSTGWKRARQG